MSLTWLMDLLQVPDGTEASQGEATVGFADPRPPQSGRVAGAGRAPDAAADH